jgi:hypothetical protein
MAIPGYQGGSMWGRSYVGPAFVPASQLSSWLFSSLPAINVGAGRRGLLTSSGGPQNPLLGSAIPGTVTQGFRKSALDDVLVVVPPLRLLVVGFNLGKTSVFIRYVWIEISLRSVPAGAGFLLA